MTENPACCSPDAVLQDAAKLMAENDCGEIPDFLNLDVPNGDWIFGCDRRIWQTAIYGYFIQKNGKAFPVHNVDKWLQNTVGCKVPDCAKTVGIYGRRYPNILPDEMAGNLPSSWDTLKAFLRALCDYELLEFSGPDRQVKGSSWYKIRSENPSF